MSYTSYFIQGFLRQPNRAKAREYLGIGEEDGGSGTPGPPGPPGSGDVTGPASAVAGNFASFGDGTGKLLADSGAAAANVPTANQKAALAGTDGSPAAGNPYVTDSDPRLVGGSGTVTSVALTAPSILSVAGSPVTTAGSLDLTLANQNANLVFAGPATGAAAAPTMRALVAADIPASVKAWDVELTKPSDQTVTDSATPQNDDFLFTTLAANTFYLIELQLIYSGNNTTGDYRGRFTFPTAVSGGVVGTITGFNVSGVATTTTVGQASLIQWPTGDIGIFTDLEANLRTCLVRFQLVTAGAGGTLQYQFSNMAAAAGRTSTTRAGTVLRLEIISP